MSAMSPVGGLMVMVGVLVMIVQGRIGICHWTRTIWQAETENTQALKNTIRDIIMYLKIIPISFCSLET